VRFLFLFLSACGYSTSQAEAMPKGFRKVYVNQAMDNTTDVGLAATLTRVLRERIDTSKAATLVSLGDAEVVLEARIDSASDYLSTAINTDPKSTAPAVPKYVLGMVGSVRLIDKNAQIVWSSGPVRVEEDYLSGQLGCPGGCSQALAENAIPATESNRRRALDRAAEALANQLYSRLVENF
jgi:hypothetical protein